ncbi:MAG TPA: type II secretion system protein GspC [Solimonas sp.]
MATTLTLHRLGQLYERHGRSLPPLATIGLTMLVAWLLAQLVWALVPVPEAARWQPAPVAPEVKADRGGPDLARIAGAQLFGAYRPEAAPAGNLQEAPDTRLSLTLLGILSGNQRDSRALIASSNGEEKPYAIGDDIVSGANLQAIFPDRVILSRNGQLETLRLNRDAPSRAVDTRPVDSVGSAGTSAMLGQIREQILADPTKAAEFVRVQPANVNGQLRGYRIYPGRERAAFTDAGLRPGDLVTSVNGIQLDDNQKALQMLGDLSRAGSVTLTVERGGQPQTITLSFN